eukprot:ANDGO_08277.mRNA.1 hypothetical protein
MDKIKKQLINKAIADYAAKMPAKGVAGMAVHTAASMLGSAKSGTSSAIGKVEGAVGSSNPLKGASMPKGLTPQACEQAAMKVFGNSSIAREAGRRAFGLIRRVQ